MLSLTLENVRTFAGRTEVPIRPLTILTGENSAGKTTFLAALATVCDPERFPFSSAFNRPPYNLGSFDTIATFRGGRSGRARTFTMGYKTDDPPHSAEAVFRSRGGQPSLAELTIQTRDTAARFTVDDAHAHSYRVMIAAEIGKRKYDFTLDLPRQLVESRPLSLTEILLSADGEKGLSKRLDLARRLGDITGRIAPISSTSIAPIRSKPERIYGQLTDSYTPSGNHIPFLLERLVEEQPDSPQTLSVFETIASFGDESGLFKRIEVRKLGTKPDDPFQLLVTMEGRTANLIDVGYGVSQALPLIVQSVLVERDHLLLMQQPEVHLHPRAQAALGSLFSRLVAKGHKQLVIETHSDFIIDRIRQHVAQGELKASDVSILFFERSKAETEIHVISLDSDGNIINAPPGYRDFFIQEEWRVLTRTP